MKYAKKIQIDGQEAWRCKECGFLNSEPDQTCDCVDGNGEFYITPKKEV